ncbi:MAG: DUF1275 domain-containing protein [Burkholderiales bacterium]|nr:DUF1275 domain-containing protein [Burkholderiales bacterium]
MEQTFEQNKNWIYRAVIFLSMNGGFVNSITFESFFHNPVGYVTGNITFAASYLTDIQIFNFIDVISAIGGFLLGSILSGLIIPHNYYYRDSKYNLAFSIEACLLFLGMLGLIAQIPTSKYLLAVALGLQNGCTTHYGKSMIRTTHMTGTTTDLGILIAHKLIKRYDVPMWKLLIRLFLLLGFFLGSVCGIIAYKTIGYYGLILSVVVCIIMLKLNIAKALTNRLFQDNI